MSNIHHRNDLVLRVQTNIHLRFSSYIFNNLKHFAKSNCRSLSPFCGIFIFSFIFKPSILFIQTSILEFDRDEDFFLFYFYKRVENSRHSSHGCGNILFHGDHICQPTPSRAKIPTQRALLPGRDYDQNVHTNNRVFSQTPRAQPLVKTTTNGNNQHFPVVSYTDIRRRWHSAQRVSIQDQHLARMPTFHI